MLTLAYTIPEMCGYQISYKALFQPVLQSLLYALLFVVGLLVAFGVMFAVYSLAMLVVANIGTIALVLGALIVGIVGTYPKG